jgi:hypothetical protein
MVGTIAGSYWLITNKQTNKQTVWRLVGKPTLPTDRAIAADGEGREFLTTDSEVPVYIPGATKFSLSSSGSGRGPLSFVMILEKPLGRNSSDSCLETEIDGSRDSLHWSRQYLLPAKVCTDRYEALSRGLRNCAQSEPADWVTSCIEHAN